MKKKFAIKNVNCANCAAKIEEEISKLEGVNKVNLSFLMQKLSLDVEESKVEEILKKANEISQKIEPGSYIE